LVFENNVRLRKGQRDIRPGFHATGHSAYGRTNMSRSMLPGLTLCQPDDFKVRDNPHGWYGRPRCKQCKHRGNQQLKCGFRHQFQVCHKCRLAPVYLIQLVKTPGGM
jgi:hypothetical protein